MQLVIFNTDGQTVKELQQVTSNRPVNLADWPSGYYVLKIITTSGISIQKFIKTKNHSHANVLPSVFNLTPFFYKTVIVICWLINKVLFHSIKSE